MNDQATALAVQEQAAPKVLHLASHAYFLVDEEKEKSNADSLLRLQDDNTPLPKALQGENPLLRSGIVLAGARSSLLSLWKGNDAATAAFMQSFYKRLKAGEGRADALATTQQEFRNHSLGGWRHPDVWAAFQLSGDGNPSKTFKKP